MLNFIFFITILYWIVLTPKSVNTVNRYIFVCSFLFCAIIAFRNEAIYGDTYGYVYQFTHLSEMSMNQIMEMFDKDKFFWIISYYLSILFNGNYTLWLATNAILVIVPLTKLIHKYSLQPMYSFALFAYLGLWFFFMAGLRQTVAIAFILMGALVLFDNTRTTKHRVLIYFICVCVAYLFHGASFVAILVLLFINRPLNRSALLFYFLTLALCFISGHYLMSNAIGFIGQFDERYIGYGETFSGATYTYFLQQLVLIIPSLLFLRKRFYEQPLALIFHFSIIGLLLVSLSPIIAEMFRLSYFFSWANILLFTYTIGEMRKYNKFFPILFLIIFIMFTIWVYKSSAYYFFFEDVTHITSQFDMSEYLI